MAARKKSEEPSINIDEVLTDEELKAVANESEPAERKAKPEDGPRTVVVAEDEAVNRMDLVAMLEDNGYEVVGQAANGEEAVELTRKYRPDVVCMDVKMPRMDGITAAGIICDETSPRRHAHRILPDRSGEEGHRRWRHGIRHQAVRGIQATADPRGGHGPFRRDQRFAGQRGA